MHFLQFCADLSKKSNSIKVIYIYTSERSGYVFSENGIAYFSMTYSFGDIRVWSWRLLLNLYWVSIFFYILIANISWTVAQTTINHIIFWKSVMRTFRFIYINCFNRLRFFVEVSTKLQKMHFFGQFKEENMETRQMIAVFSSTFSALFVIFIFVFENSQNSFSCSPP